MSLDTARLTLVPCAPEQLLALIEQPDRFEDLVGFPVADGLHGFYASDDVSPKWVAALRDASGQEPDPWRHGFFVVHKSARCVIGSAGFKGAPDADGVVEIAYGVVPTYEGQGYATEAAAALVTYAFDHGAERVRAHTLPVANASGRVLLKNGFHQVGPVVDPEDGPVWRWERVLSALVLCALLGCSAPSPWVQVWSDEFSGAAGAAIDTTKWRYDTADGCAGGNCGWGNNEKEYYSRGPENIALNGQGQLAIVARTAPPGLKCYYGPCRYTSAKITTRGKVDVVPGRVEARIKLAPGQGLWPAFWLLGTNIPAVGWPASGELDVMENRGSASTITSSAIHGPGYSGNTPFVHARALERSTFTDSFHTFAVEWDSLAIRFFVDDTTHYLVTRGEVERFGKWVFDQPFFVIVNLAVGGHFDGDPASDAILPATMLVDYVRVYRPGPARVN